MKRTIISTGIILILLLSSLSFSPIIAYKNLNRTIYVDDTGLGQYTSINEAIDNAINGDTIFVYSGMYKERVTIDKSIHLIGQDKYTTIINGDFKGNTVSITYDYCVLDGFTITNSSNGDRDAGLYVKSDYNIIRNNIITQTRAIKYIENASFNKFEYNLVEQNYHGPTLWGGCNYNNFSYNDIVNQGWYGIDTESSRFNIFFRNNITQTSDSAIQVGSDSQIIENNIIGQVSFFQGENCTIKNNTINDGAIVCGSVKNCFIFGNRLDINSSLRTGLVIYERDSDFAISNITISHNIIMNGGKGIQCGDKDIPIENFLIVNNTILNNQVGIRIGGIHDLKIMNNSIGNIELWGIYLHDSIGVEIRYNTIFACDDDGIWLDDSDMCFISQNYIIDNFDGIYIKSSDDNDITTNFFSGNVRGIQIYNSCNGKIFDNEIDNNSLGIILRGDPYFAGGECLNNNFSFNNFISNGESVSIKENWQGRNIWDYNYWEKARFFPKFLWNEKIIFPHIDIDWNPTSEPYDIPIGGI